MKTLVALLLFAGTAFATSYSTNFPAGEMAGPNWIQGKTTGINWCNVVNIPGFAYGTQTGSQPYDDSTAVVAGSWGNDQSAQGVVSIPALPPSVNEVEIRLRTTIKPGSITGYEFNGSVSPSGGAYMQIVRWNGPLSSFTPLISAALLLHSGDVLMATAKGNVLTLYRNGTAVCTATDSTFPSGSPGIGMYNSIGFDNSGYGFSSFSATDNGSSAPSPTPVATPVPKAYAAWEASLLNEMRAAGISNTQINTVMSWLIAHPPTP